MLVEETFKLNNCGAKTVTIGIDVVNDTLETCIYLFKEHRDGIKLTRADYEELKTWGPAVDRYFKAKLPVQDVKDKITENITVEMSNSFVSKMVILNQHNPNAPPAKQATRIYYQYETWERLVMLFPLLDHLFEVKEKIIPGIKELIKLIAQETKNKFADELFYIEHIREFKSLLVYLNCDGYQLSVESPMDKFRCFKELCIYFPQMLYNAVKQISTR